MNKIVILVFFIFFNASYINAFTIDAGGVRVSYENRDLLRQFNKNVNFKSFSSIFGGGSSNLTLEEQVQNKVTKIANKVKQILEMSSPNIHYKIVLYDSTRKVQKKYYDEYKREVDFIAYYSPLSDTVYISVDDVNLRVVSHEMAHATITNYFEKQPSVNLHELMAQYVEAHIDD